MLKRLWEWLWNPEDRLWTRREIQEKVLSLELEWGEVLDKLMAREDRERKRQMKRLRDSQEGDLPPADGGVAATKDDLRVKLSRLRGTR